MIDRNHHDPYARIEKDDGKWYNSFDRMKQRPFHLVVCPKSVPPVWVKHLEMSNAGGVELYPHQANVLLKIVGRLFFLLNWGMGSGKTIAAIAIMKLLNKECRILNLVGMSKTQKIKALDNATAIVKPLVVIINYESAWRTGIAERIEKIKWSTIVFDEIQKLKAHNGKASKFFGKLTEKHHKALRLGLSGTPLSNSPLDAFAVFRALAPGVFGKSWTRFRSRYALMNPHIRGMVLRLINQDELAEKVAEHCDRVRTEDVVDLPPVRHQTIPVELSPAERKAYKEMKNDMVLELPEDQTIIPDNALTQLLRLAQMTGGFIGGVDCPGGVLRVGTGKPDKLDALIDFCESLDENEPLVVVCRFRSDLDSVGQITGRKIYELSGRKNELEKWQRCDEGSVLAVQIQAGATGIDLTRASQCVFYSIGYSLADYHQMLARTHRPGQTRSVLYTHLVVRDSVDESVYRALKNKKQVIDAVIGDLREETKGVTR